MKQFALCISVLLTPAWCLPQSRPIAVLDQIDSAINQKNCSAAVDLANTSLISPVRETALGFIYLDCYKIYKTAVVFFRSAAMAGDPISRNKLADLGVPITNSSPAPMLNKAENSRPLISAPPPYIMVEPPRVPQRVPIIISTPPVLMPNPNACIQDGGSLYCPNHSNTRITPFKF